MVLEVMVKGKPKVNKRLITDGAIGPRFFYIEYEIGRNVIGREAGTNVQLKTAQTDFQVLMAAFYAWKYCSL